MEFYPIKEYEELYVINKSGEVRGLSASGLIKDTSLKPYKKNNGYYRVTLSKSSNRKEKYVHRLVAETFIPNPENKPQVNHLDGNKANNDISNLEWCTPRENLYHAKKSGLFKSNNKMLTPEEVKEIDLLLKEKRLLHREIAKLYNVSRHTITGINKGIAWTDITKRDGSDKCIKRFGRSNPMSKRVINCRGNVFDSISEASIKLGVNPTSIGAVLKGRQKHAGKYEDKKPIKWYYYTKGDK